MKTVSRPLRVVQVSFHVDADGRDATSLLHAWPTLSAVAKAAAAAGVSVAVVQAAHRSEVVEKDGVTYYFVDDTSRIPARVLERVASLEPDVVHVQGLGSPRATRPLSRAVPDVPILVQDHGSVVPTGWRASAWRIAHSPIAGVAFTALDQATPWKRAKILRADLPVFEVLESSSDFTPGDREAARRATTMSGARLWCCFGDAPLLGNVQARIAESPVLSERVTLLGALPHDEMEMRYRAADFFIQTSHREGSGYSVLEAMACGVTPLVTDIPAMRAIVGDAGSLTPVGDASALAEAIVTWATRDASALRRATRARFDAALTFDVIGRQLRGAYEELAAGSVPSSAVSRYRVESRPMMEELR
jgi:hypothetical protein